MRVYRNGKVEELEDFEEIERSETVKPSGDDATREFFETLSSTETNSIAKIRAAAQKYLDDTKGGDE
ncbi:MAG: hypothetical protein ACLUFN_10350 [Eubacterium sp.]